MKRQIELLCSIECVFETEIYALYRLKEREGEREARLFSVYERKRKLQINEMMKGKVETVVMLLAGKLS